MLIKQWGNVGANVGPTLNSQCPVFIWDACSVYHHIAEIHGDQSK